MVLHKAWQLLTNEFNRRVKTNIHQIQARRKWSDLTMNLKKNGSEFTQDTLDNFERNAVNHSSADTFRESFDDIKDVTETVSLKHMKNETLQGDITNHDFDQEADKTQKESYYKILLKDRLREQILTLLV